MANLLSLSNELLIAIYTASPTIQSAALLSTANRRLRAVWIEHSKPIIASILQPQIPDYEDAVDLAILEETWINARPNNPASLHECLPRLLRNADLASLATTEWAAWLADDLGPSNWRNQVNYTSPHASYYIMRKLYLARIHPEADLLPVLYKTLLAASRDTWTTHEEFSGWLTGGYSHDDDKLPHGISKPKEEWTEGDEIDEMMNGYVIWDDWDWVSDVLDAGLVDGRYHGSHICHPKTLEEMVFEDPVKRAAKKYM